MGELQAKLARILDDLRAVSQLMGWAPRPNSPPGYLKALEYTRAFSTLPTEIPEVNVVVVKVMFELLDELDGVALELHDRLHSITREDSDASDIRELPNDVGASETSESSSSDKSSEGDHSDQSWDAEEFAEESDECGSRPRTPLLSVTSDRPLPAGSQKQPPSAVAKAASGAGSPHGPAPPATKQSSRTTPMDSELRMRHFLFFKDTEVSPGAPPEG